jgi:sulfonate transport system permease protein
MESSSKPQNVLRRLAIGLVLPAALVALWGGASVGGYLPEYVLPAPWTLVVAVFGFPTGIGWSSVYAGQFWSFATLSTFRVLVGFGFAAVAGVLLGALCGRWTLFNRAVDPLLQLLRSIPGIAWLPIAMVWFGIGTVTTAFLIALGAFFPVYVNTLHGVRLIPVEWIRAARIMGATPLQVFTRVVLPGAFPAVESGLRVAAGVAWAYVVLGELTGVDKGLGAMIMDARMMGDTTAILVGMVYIALLGRLTDWFIVAGTKRMRGHRA